jgi:pimeloyl-ACP methyl ester carboxylesterase
MPTVKDQDKDHPLYPLLAKYFDSRDDVEETHTRLWAPGKKRETHSPKLLICQNILRLAVERWHDLTPSEQQTWNNNCPDWARDGYHYFLWYDMVQDYGGGPFKTGESPIHDRPYLVPTDAIEGVTSYVYCGATIIGSISELAGGPKLPVTTKPILLVHGWYKDPFDPYTTWQAMTQALTGKDPTDPADYTVIYNPAHPGDPDYALRRCKGEGRVVFISNYTRDSSQGTAGDIREYAYELQSDIALAASNESQNQIDVVAHSMGGLIARAYTESEDLSDPPWPTVYANDVRKLITLGTPHQGSCLADIWPDLLGWTCLEQMEHGSEFLTELNAGTTGAALNVEYSSIAGNYYKCCDIPKFLPALIICLLGWGTENDGATDVLETKLASQAGIQEIPASRWWILDLDHTHLRGEPGEVCHSATAVKVILAGWSYQDWLAEGRPT